MRSEFVVGLVTILLVATFMPTISVAQQKEEVSPVVQEMQEAQQKQQYTNIFLSAVDGLSYLLLGVGGYFIAPCTRLVYIVFNPESGGGTRLLTGILQILTLALVPLGTAMLFIGWPSSFITGAVNLFSQYLAMRRLQENAPASKALSDTVLSLIGILGSVIVGVIWTLILLIFFPVSVPLQFVLIVVGILATLVWLLVMPVVLFITYRYTDRIENVLSRVYLRIPIIGTAFKNSEFYSP